MTGMAALVEKLFAEGFIAGKYREYRIRQAWGVVAGDHLAKHARPDRLVNGTLFVIMTITIFSGLAISEVVVPLAGASTSTLRAWRQLHSVLAALGLGVVGLHVALNWDWIAGVVRKGTLFRAPAGALRRLSPDEIAVSGAEET